MQLTPLGKVKPCPADCVLISSTKRAVYVDSHMQSAAAESTLGIAWGEASSESL